MSSAISISERRDKLFEAAEPKRIILIIFEFENFFSERIKSTVLEITLHNSKPFFNLKSEEKRETELINSNLGRISRERRFFSD